MIRQEWKRDLKTAMAEAEGGNRLPLLIFTGKDCEGSQKTLSEVFTQDEVIGAIERDTVPVAVDIDTQKEMCKRYRVEWTPAFVICDNEGNELERWEGYLPKEDFVPQLILSKGLAAFHLQRYDEAVREFELLIDEHPASELLPEAEYYMGAASFKLTGETDRLSEACHELIMTHPDSPWTKRCSIWGRGSNYFKTFVGYAGGGSAGSGAY